MIYVEMLLPGQKSQVTPLFPEPLASYFSDNIIQILKIQYLILYAKPCSTLHT